MGNPLVEVQKFGQSIWYDNIQRGLITSGELQAMVDHDGLLGITSNPAIFENALAGGHPLCTANLDLFAAIYGAEAGNLALKCLAVGGVYVGGGIAPKILPKLLDGTFIRAFTAKGRFAELMRTIAVKVALNPRAPLVGAAYYALML